MARRLVQDKSLSESIWLHHCRVEIELNPDLYVDGSRTRVRVCVF